MKKVVMIGQENHPIPPFKGAAVEWWMNEVAKRLITFRTYLFSVSDMWLPNKEYRDGVYYQRFNVGRVYKRLFRKITKLDPYPYEKRLAKAMDRLSPDILHVHNAPRLLARITKFTKAKPRIILHMHNEDKTINGIEFDALVGCSKYIVNRYKKELGSDHEFQCIYNGVDLHRYKPYWEVPNRRKTMRDIFGLKDDEFVFLYVGRISPEKGVVELIEAFKRMLKVNGRVKLLIVGEISRGDPRTSERVAYGEKVKSAVHGIRNSVVLTDVISPEKMHHVYPAADVLVAPSLFNEPFSMTTIEGMAVGLPVLVSRRGGLVEYVRDYDNGIFIDNVEDTLEMTDKMMNILGDSGLREKLGKNGVTTARERFSWDQIAKDSEAFYSYLLGSAV